MSLPHYQIEALIIIADEGNPRDSGWCTIDALSTSARSALADLEEAKLIQFEPHWRRIRMTAVGLCHLVLEEEERGGSIGVTRLANAALLVLSIELP